MSGVSTMMSTLHDGYIEDKNEQLFRKIKGGNLGVPIYLVIYLGWESKPLSVYCTEKRMWVA